MKKFLGFLIGVFLIIGVTSNSFASTVVAGYTFDDNAFADSIISSVGTYNTAGGSLENVITDSDLTTWAFANTPYTVDPIENYLEVGFTDNYLVNGNGYDLALFEIAVPDSFSFSITVGGASHNYNSSATGYFIPGTYGSWAVNVALIDLDDFGVASGALLSSGTIGMVRLGPSLAVVGALNSSDVNPVPVPTTLLLFGSGIVGLAGLRRKFKK